MRYLPSPRSSSHNQKIQQRLLATISFLKTLQLIQICWWESKANRVQRKINYRMVRMSIRRVGPRLLRIRGRYTIIKMVLIQAISLKISISLIQRISNPLLISMKRPRDPIPIKLATASWLLLPWIELVQAPLCVINPPLWTTLTSLSSCLPTMQTLSSATPCNNFTNLSLRHVYSGARTCERSGLNLRASL